MFPIEIAAGTALDARITEVMPASRAQRVREHARDSRPAAERA